MTGPAGRTVSARAHVTATIPPEEVAGPACGLVGRAGEFERLVSGLGEDGPAGMFVHGAPRGGQAGVLAAPAAPAAAAGAPLARLHGRGVRPATRPVLHQARRLARGHPLTWGLAVAGAAGRPALDIEEQAATAVFDALTRLYVTDLPSATRHALDAAAIVRRVTLPLLAAMLDGDAADGAFESLAALPFVANARDGLVLHEALQEALARRLRATDPERHRRYRTLAWRQLRREVRAVTRHEFWRYTADMLYLIENPTIREAFFPASSQQVSVAPAKSAEKAELLALT